MGKSAPKPPPAPDPTAIINTSQAANADTARLQAKLNNSNYSGPEGNVNWTNNGDQWTQNVQLSPMQQRIYDEQGASEEAAMRVAFDQVGRVNSALGTPLSAPGLNGNVGQGQIAGGYASPDRPLSYVVPTNTLQNTYDPGGPIQQHVGPTDFTADRNAVTDGVYKQATSRLDPQFQQQQEQLQAQLTAQGLSPNSSAYQTQMDNFNRARTDAYNQANYSAIQQGAAEQQQLFGQRVAQGQFANTAQQQQFGQNQQQFNDYNTATLGQFGEDLQARQFGNQAVAQGDAQSQAHAAFGNTAEQQRYNEALQSAGFGNTTANQDFQNRAYAQTLPINELTGLLGLGQVGMPQSTQGNSSVAPSDVTGAYALQAQAQQNAYQANMANYQSSMGGLFNLGSAALKAAPSIFMSDARLKRDVVKVGERPDGIGLYRFRYHGHDGLHVGVIAQEAQRIRPDAVHDIGGVLHVDYWRLA